MLPSPTQMNRALDMISPKPMVDGFVKIFDEFRNGCDEKSVTITPQLHCIRYVPYRMLLKISNLSLSYLQSKTKGFKEILAMILFVHNRFFASNSWDLTNIKVDVLTLRKSQKLRTSRHLSVNSANKLSADSIT